MKGKTQMLKLSESEMRNVKGGRVYYVYDHGTFFVVMWQDEDGNWHMYKHPKFN